MPKFAPGLMTLLSSVESTPIERTKQVTETVTSLKQTASHEGSKDARI